MLNIASINIKDRDKFTPAEYPVAVHELAILIQGIAHIPIYYNVEIVVSYLKNHCLKTDWIDANPVLTQMMTSGYFKTPQLESLFESCRNNTVFLKDFEEYISRQLLMRKN